MTKAGCHSERIKFSGLPRGGLRLRASERLRNRLRLPRCVRSCARETNRGRGRASAGYAAGRGAETAALRRLAVRSGAAYGTASSRTRAPIPQRQQPRTSGCGAELSTPGARRRLEKTLPCARHRRSAPGEVGPPGAAVGGEPTHIGAGRAEGPGKERVRRSYSRGAERRIPTQG